VGCSLQWLARMPLLPRLKPCEKFYGEIQSGEPAHQRRYPLISLGIVQRLLAVKPATIRLLTPPGPSPSPLPDSATASCRANPRHRGRRRHCAYAGEGSPVSPKKKALTRQLSYRSEGFGAYPRS
jgi:hypothetical protein